jgi:hypothetical protein
MNCPCGKPSPGADTLCSDHWHRLPGSLKNAWRQAEREGGESRALLTAKVREYTELQISIDQAERRAASCGANKFREQAIAAEVKRQTEAQRKILHHCGFREAAVA